MWMIIIDERNQVLVECVEDWGKEKVVLNGFRL